MNEATEARLLALEVLNRIEKNDSYANLALKPALNNSDLEGRDRALVTELVYGVIRMRRACDFLIDRYLRKRLQPEVRTILRLGAYQLHWTKIPNHAAVNDTVALAPKWARGLCNAVLRKVAEEAIEWPSEAVQLSYPDWIFKRLHKDLGLSEAKKTLEAMNKPRSAVIRDDGYFQDKAAQLVGEIFSRKGEWGSEVTIDLCAAPGGKATAAVANGMNVVASDSSLSRIKLIRSNALKLGAHLPMVVTDGRKPAYRRGVASRVLVDAPCSGLGVLRRRPDARWRITESDVVALAELQVDLLTSAFDLLKPGGLLVYSVCTLTSAETIEVDEKFQNLRAVKPLDLLSEPWRKHGNGGILFPHDLDSEGMAIFCYESSK